MAAARVEAELAVVAREAELEGAEVAEKAVEAGVAVVRKEGVARTRTGRARPATSPDRDAAMPRRRSRA